jgi:hypothetical protein
MRALRFRAALFFAVPSTLFSIVMEIDALMESGNPQLIQNWQPVYWVLPFTLLTAVTGFAVSKRCLRPQLRQLIWPSVIVALFWSVSLGLAVVYYGHFVEGSPVSAFKLFWRGVGMFSAILLPFSYPLCALVRWYGRKNGLAK